MTTKPKYFIYYILNENLDIENVSYAVPIFCAIFLTIIITVIMNLVFPNPTDIFSMVGRISIILILFALFMAFYLFFFQELTTKKYILYKEQNKKREIITLDEYNKEINE